MPVAAYYSWDRLGRPLTPAQPVRELVEALRAAYPAAAAQNLFSWYADEDHYAAVPAEDHTPFSQTGWPLASPFWWVCATDIMHRPDLGVDCDAIFAHIIASARAGLTPWLKYVIWQGARYDVRADWIPVGASGHFDHIHLSTRTDHLATGLGSWSPMPHAEPTPPPEPEDDDMRITPLYIAQDDAKGVIAAVWLDGDETFYKNVGTVEAIPAWQAQGFGGIVHVDVDQVARPAGSRSFPAA